GLRLASSRPGPAAPIAAAVNVVFLCVFAGAGILADNRTDLPAFVVSAVGLLAAAVTVVCGWAGLDGRVGRWPAGRMTSACLVAALIGLTLAAAAFLWGDRLRDFGDPWSQWPPTLHRYLGRISSWCLAVSLGLAVGALLGRAKQPLGGRVWAVQLG